MRPAAVCSLSSPRMSVTADQVHVWHVPLDLSQSEVANLEEHLASDERSRAARFLHSSDRLRFVACRGTLREILSRYLGEAPSEIEFAYSKYGKPRLRLSDDSHLLRFNVSHSDGLAVFAITHGREVGVDIERAQAEFAWEEIAASFFSAREISVLQALPIQRRYEAFLNAWTSKEACAKARGNGLSLPLEQLDAPQLPDASCSLDPLRNASEPSPWTFKSFAPVAGFVGALVVEGTDWQMTCREWRG
jgi:4'-phosphopantetheinyl transferase